HPHGILISLPIDPIPFNDIPTVPIRSVEKLCKISDKKFAAALNRSIEWWLVNAVSLIQIALQANSENFNELFLVLIDSVNGIGVSYGQIFGKEIGAKLIRDVFLFSIQAVEFIAFVMQNLDPTFNNALWDIRANDL